MTFELNHSTKKSTFDMLDNPLCRTYAPNFIDVLVSQQGHDIRDAIFMAVQQNRTNVVYDKVMYDQNMQILINHGFRVVSVPPAMTVANSVVKYTISWG